MKRPTAASLKKVNAENLANLGAERLAEILVSVAAGRPELKRRLRMELAAEQGAEHLTSEIDKRLASLESSRGKISWRQRPGFIRDADTLRALISDRLATLDRPAALSRLWTFLGLWRRITSRLRDKDGDLSRVFERAARDAGTLLAEGAAEADPASVLVEALVEAPAAWAAWLPALLETAGANLAKPALRLMSDRAGASLTWMPLIRQLADAAGDADAYAASFSSEARKTPAIAADIAQRLLASGRIVEAGEVLQGAERSRAGTLTHAGPEDQIYAWESAWIDYLAQAGRAEEAQAARWASFERTLAGERAKAFTSQLDGFDDVEAEGRAFAYAAGHKDFRRGLAFLMAWPALFEAAQMIMARGEEAVVGDEEAELWAAKLRTRHPAAAHQLLRKAAAAAFRRRDFKTCDRLTEEADALQV